MTAFWVALGAAVPGLAAAIIGLMNRSKIQEVHVLVDGNLSKAVEEIATLKEHIKTTAVIQAATDAATGLRTLR
jgi:hypothetical protein